MSITHHLHAEFSTYTKVWSRKKQALFHLLLIKYCSKFMIYMRRRNCKSKDASLKPNSEDPVSVHEATLNL